MSSPLRRFRGPAVRPDYATAWRRRRRLERLKGGLAWCLFWSLALLAVVAIGGLVYRFHAAP